MPPSPLNPFSEFGEAQDFFEAISSILGRSPPAIVYAGLGRFAPLLFKCRIVRVAFRASPVISGRVIGIERRALAQAPGQVRVCQKLSPERDHVRAAVLEPGFGAVPVKAASQHQRSAILRAHQIEKGERTGIRLAALVKVGRRRIDEMKIGEVLARELLSDCAEGGLGI